MFSKSNQIEKNIRELPWCTRPDNKSWKNIQDTVTTVPWLIPRFRDDESSYSSSTSLLSRESGGGSHIIGPPHIPHIHHRFPIDSTFPRISLPPRPPTFSSASYVFPDFPPPLRSPLPSLLSPNFFLFFPHALDHLSPVSPSFCPLHPPLVMAINE